MIRTEKSVRVLQAVAAIAGLAVLLWSLGLPSLRFADAANLTFISDTVSNSDLNAASNHEIDFTIPADGTPLANGDTVTITFPDGASDFDLSNLGLLSIDFATATDYTVDQGAPGADNIGVATSTFAVVFTLGANVTIATGTAVTVELGTNADFGGAPPAVSSQIVNPNAQASYQIDIATNEGDAGSTHVYILDNVDISASVDTNFTFAVAGVAGGETVNGTTTTGATTPTAIEFGTLEAGGANATTTAQLLTVNTNAARGYVVTVQVDDTLISSTGADIDLFDDGVENDVPAAWDGPSGTLGNDDTYGHWGITSDDLNTNGVRTNDFTSDTWIAASTTPRVVMAHNGPVTGQSGVGVGTTSVGFKVQITALQEAGDDYQAVLTYVATPTF